MREEDRPPVGAVILYLIDGTSTNLSLLPYHVFRGKFLGLQNLKMTHTHTHINLQIISM